jgi:hypothetical protein
MNSTAVQFINFGAAAVQLDLFCAPCQGALFSPVKDRAGKLWLQPEALHSGSRPLSAAISLAG